MKTRPGGLNVHLRRFANVICHVCSDNSMFSQDDTTPNKATNQTTCLLSWGHTVIQYHHDWHYWPIVVDSNTQLDDRDFGATIWLFTPKGPRTSGLRMVWSDHLSMSRCKAMRSMQTNRYGGMRTPAGTRDPGNEKLKVLWQLDGGIKLRSFHCSPTSYVSYFSTL